MLSPLLAAASAQPGPFIAVLVLGLVVGVFGHIIASRGLILTGIAIVGLVSVYFLLAQPGSR